MRSTNITYSKIKRQFYLAFIPSRLLTEHQNKQDRIICNYWCVLHVAITVFLLFTLDVQSGHPGSWSITYITVVASIGYFLEKSPKIVEGLK